MNLSDLKSSESMTFRDVACRLISSEKMISTEGRIRRSGDNRFELITKDPNSYAFIIENRADEAAITAHIEQRQQNLVKVVTVPQSSTDGSSDLFYLHIVFFGSAMRIGRWYVTLDEKIKSEFLKMRLGKTAEEIEAAVKRNFLLNTGGRDCFALTIGKYDPQEYAPEPYSDERSQPESIKQSNEVPEDTDNAGSDAKSWMETSANNTVIALEKSIVIYGADFSILVRVEGHNGGEFLRAIRIDKKNRYRPIMMLAIGELIFQDHQVLIEKQLRQQLSSVRGYLDLWSSYASAEGDFLLRRARTVGTFQIRTSTHGKQGVIVYPKGLSADGWAQIKVNEQLLFTPNVPVYLQEDMTWNDYQAYLQDLREARGEHSTSVQSDSEKGELFSILDVQPKDGFIVLDGTNRNLPSENYVSLSILGQKAQIERREAARHLIDNAQAEKPGLGLIIEGYLPELSDDTGPHKRIEPLSSLVREKIFEHDPTPTQIDAISMALNTPDIAIIQGPPGTGKTTVITAIIERLNEIADHRKANQGSVLVTSFQHDAVRNVIARLRINSLPTIKFGRQGQEDQTAEQVLDDWRVQYAEKLRQKNPGIRESEEQKTLEKLRAVYIAYPSNENALHLLKFARQSTFGKILEEKIADILNTFEADEPEVSTKLLPKIRRLRTSKEAFLDDGIDTAYDLLHDLRRKFASVKSGPIIHILDVLESAADCINEPDESILQELKTVQHDLLQYFVPIPSYHQDAPRVDVLDLCEQLTQCLQRPSDEKDRILVRMLNELENNSDRVRDTISAYNFVYAATTQQSEGSDIRRAKKIVARNEHPSYDTVVIDEAARVNPGDLLIPMTQARRRIILVGDHRQLPHIYDEEIFESMQADDVSVDKNIVKESMFQYLMQKAKELTAQDHIPRTITLNAQYRMHPMLGEFVSDNFYKPYGEGFVSPRPASDFTQVLWHKPLKWVNFSGENGRAEKRGTSWIRTCEADYIANTLEQYLNSPDGAKLKYGVITFYSGQKELILKKLRKKLGTNADQVRVGSVDAFQGMEFDVIFLSVVRCQSGDVRADWARLEKDVACADKENGEFQQWSEERQKAGLKHYGFLVSENRLCVALSRQKKLLIVVGDAGAFTNGDWGRLAKICVPAMQRLVELCKSEGVLIDGKT